MASEIDLSHFESDHDARLDAGNLGRTARDDLDEGIPQKVGWYNEVWGKTRAEFRKSTVADEGTFTFLGDSITQAWGKIGIYFPKNLCASRDISGDTTRRILYRLQEDVLNQQSAAVVLLIGAKEIGIGTDPGRRGGELTKHPCALMAASKDGPGKRI